MKSSKSRMTLLALVLVCLLINGAAVHAAPESAPSGELSFAIEQLGTEAMDPVLNSMSAKAMFTPIFDYLIGVGTDGKLSTKTGVADGWKLSPDSMKLTVHLRSGIRFHNGDEITSADVKFSLDQFISKRCVGTNSNYIRKVIKNVEAPDPRTVIINYKEPSAVLANYLSREEGTEGIVLPKKYIEEKGLEYFGTHPVGSGPYRFVEQRTGSYIKYEAVDYPHWRVGVPKFKYLTIYIVKEESTRLAMLKTKAVDIIVISRDKVKELPGFKIYAKPGSAIVGLYVNNQWDKTTYLSNEKFREALALSLNGEEIKNYIFEGKGVLSGSGTAYGSWAVGYKPVPLVPFDPDKAKKLVKAAFPGETPQLNIYVWKAGGVPETFTLAEAIAGYFKKIGVNAKIIPTEYSSYRKELSKKEPNLRNSVGVMRLPNRSLWGGAYSLLFHSKGTLSMAHDPKLDALIDDLISEHDPDKVGPKQYDVALYMREHYIQIPILEVANLLAANPEKVTQWPNLALPFAQDFFLDDIYTR